MPYLSTAFFFNIRNIVLIVIILFFSDSYKHAAERTQWSGGLWGVRQCGCFSCISGKWIYETSGSPARGNFSVVYFSDIDDSEGLEGGKKSSLNVKSDCICLFVLCDNKYVYCEMNSLLLTFTTFYKMALRALKLCVSYEGENLLGQF